MAAELLWPEPPWVPTPIVGLEMKCFSETQPLPWSFCLNRVPASTSHDVLYYFHGRNGAATWWNDETYYSGDVQRRWAKDGVSPPTVIAVSFGSMWLMNDTTLLPIFLKDVMARAEAELPHPVGRRMLVGESMGGVNALVVGLKTKGVFAKVAALCPPLPPLSPSASVGEQWRYLRRSSTSVQRAGLMWWFSKRFYESESAWEANFPVPLSAQTDALTTSFYLSCGLKDEWGCQEGTTLVADRLKQRGANVELHLLPGGHCAIDSESLAAFLGR